jgi:hypothetical protein
LAPAASDGLPRPKPAGRDRIHDRLSALLSRPNVFFDVSTIRGGENFENKIVDAIGKCDGALVFIGDKWLEASAASKSRIWNDKDYVRTEVREARPSIMRCA